MPRASSKDTQTNVHVKQWYEHARQLAGVFGYPVLGLGADGDSAVRFVYESQYKQQGIGWWMILELLAATRFLTSPGASKRAVMPQMGRTRGWPAGGDALGEPPSLGLLYGLLT